MIYITCDDYEARQLKKMGFNYHRVKLTSTKFQYEFEESPQLENARDIIRQQKYIITQKF